MLRAAAGAFSALVVLLWLASCTTSVTPTPALPTATVTAPAASATAPLSTATVPPTPSQTPSPLPHSTPDPDALPSGWRRETNEQLSIAIPAGWRAIGLSGVDAQAAFDALKKTDARLAGIIGGPEALQSVAFWAFAPEPAPGSEHSDFVDNLNVRRSPLGPSRVTDLQQVLDVLLPEYEKMGLKVTSTDATVRVNDLPAARITYTMMMNTAEGQPFEVRGRQVIVATDSDLWILSFSTTPEREGELAPEFETSAQSFRPK